MADVPSITEIKRVTQPSSIMDRPNGEHWVGRLYMRRISPYVTRIALRLGVSANAVTAMMIVVGLFGAWAFALPGPVALVGLLLVQLYILLDCVDGEVARFNGTEGVAGIYLDRWGHYVAEASMFAAIGVRAADGTNQMGYMVAGVAGAALAMLAKAETDLVDTARLQAGLGRMPQQATTMQSSGLAKGRSLARYFPIHRLVHATEAAFAAGVAVVIDLIRDDLWATRGLLMLLVGVIIVVVPLHLVSVLNSTRLTAKGE